MIDDTYIERNNRWIDDRQIFKKQKDNNSWGMTQWLSVLALQA